MNEPLSSEGLYANTYAALPTVGVRNGVLAWVSDGRKSGEGAGSGTGILAYFNEADRSWRRFRDDAAVTT